MSKLLKPLFSILVVLACFVVFHGGAHAAANSTVTYSPKASPRAGCENRNLSADFSAYLSDVSFDTNNGVLKYKVGLGWKSCGYNTRSYAIYSNGPNICPISGYYSGQPPYGVATDCVKYIGNPPSYSGPSGLTCWGGTNADCTTGANGSQLIASDQPSNFNLAQIARSQTYPNWSSNSANGSWNVNESLCEYYKYPPYGSGNVGVGLSCIPMSITVNWSTPAQPTCSLTASPGTIQNGNSSTLSWSTNNFASGMSSKLQTSGGSVTLNPNAGSNGSYSVSPAATTGYKLQIYNVDGSTSSNCFATVTVSATPPLHLAARSLAPLVRLMPVNLQHYRGLHLDHIPVLRLIIV